MSSSERETYSQLALEIFSKYPPKDGRHGHSDCPHCSQAIADWLVVLFQVPTEGQKKRGPRESLVQFHDSALFWIFFFKFLAPTVRIPLFKCVTHAHRKGLMDSTLDR